MKNKKQKKAETISEIGIPKKKYSMFSNVIYILKEAYKHMKIIPYMFVANGITSALATFSLLLVPKIVIDCIQNGDFTQPIQSIQAMIFKVLPLGMVWLIFTGLTQLFENQYWWRIEYVLGKFMIKKVNRAITMDYQRLEQPEMLDCMKKAEAAIENTWSGIGGLFRGVNRFLSCLISVLIAVFSIMVLNPLVVVGMLILSFGNFFFLLQAKKVDKKKHWDVMGDKWRRLEYMDNKTRDFKYAKDIRVFNMTNWLKRKQTEEHHKAHILFRNHYYRWVGFASLMQIFAFLQDILIFGWLIYNVLYNGMSLGKFSLYMGIAQTFFTSTVGMFDSLGDMKQNSLYVDDYRTFVEYVEPKNENEINMQIFEQYEFTFEHVYFKYSGQEDYTLKDINITLKAGERAAVVGLNGAGKTTFIKLLCRLYEPTKGRILLNGVDIQNYNKEEYYGIISPVFQDVECFAFPISENVSMSSPQNTDVNKAEECVRKANLAEQIEKFENGINTELLKILHDDGVDLSGGQKQKLALARALYKDAPVVVLDEPTAALDALAEHKMYEDFDKLIGGKTAVYISHRLSSTQFCNVIIMFESGQIAEYGTHEELLNKKGRYAELFEVQAQYYKEEGELANA